MSEALLAVEGLRVGTESTPAVEATIVVPPPTAPVLGENKRAHVDGMVAIVTNITVPSAGATTPDPGPYDATFTATSQKNFTQLVKLLREGDQSNQINATPQIPGSPPTPYPISFVCVISDAGQASVFIV